MKKALLPLHKLPGEIKTELQALGIRADRSRDIEIVTRNLESCSNKSIKSLQSSIHFHLLQHQERPVLCAIAFIACAVGAQQIRNSSKQPDEQTLSMLVLACKSLQSTGTYYSNSLLPTGEQRMARELIVVLKYTALPQLVLEALRASLSSAHRQSQQSKTAQTYMLTTLLLLYREIPLLRRRLDWAHRDATSATQQFPSFDHPAFALRLADARGSISLLSNLMMESAADSTRVDQDAGEIQLAQLWSCAACGFASVVALHLPECTTVAAVCFAQHFCGTFGLTSIQKVPAAPEGLGVHSPDQSAGGEQDETAKPDTAATPWSFADLRWLIEDHCFAASSLSENRLGAGGLAEQAAAAGLGPGSTQPLSELPITHLPDMAARSTAPHFSAPAMRDFAFVDRDSRPVDAPGADDPNTDRYRASTRSPSVEALNINAADLTRSMLRSVDPIACIIGRALSAGELRAWVLVREMLAGRHWPHYRSHMHQLICAVLRRLQIILFPRKRTTQDDAASPSVPRHKASASVGGGGASLSPPTPSQFQVHHDPLRTSALWVVLLDVLKPVADLAGALEITQSWDSVFSQAFGFNGQRPTCSHTLHLNAISVNADGCTGRQTSTTRSDRHHRVCTPLRMPRSPSTLASGTEAPACAVDEGPWDVMWAPSAPSSMPHSAPLRRSVSFRRSMAERTLVRVWKQALALKSWEVVLGSVAERRVQLEVMQSPATHRPSEPSAATSATHALETAPHVLEASSFVSDADKLLRRALDVMWLAQDDHYAVCTVASALQRVLRADPLDMIHDSLTKSNSLSSIVCLLHTVVKLVNESANLPANASTSPSSTGQASTLQSTTPPSRSTPTARRAILSSPGVLSATLTTPTEPTDGSDDDEAEVVPLTWTAKPSRLISPMRPSKRRSHVQPTINEDFFAQTESDSPASWVRRQLQLNQLNFGPLDETIPARPKTSPPVDGAQAFSLVHNHPLVTEALKRQLLGLVEQMLTAADRHRIVVVWTERRLLKTLAQTHTGDGVYQSFERTRPQQAPAEVLASPRRARPRSQSVGSRDSASPWQGPRTTQANVPAEVMEFEEQRSSSILQLLFTLLSDGTCRVVAGQLLGVLLRETLIWHTRSKRDRETIEAQVEATISPHVQMQQHSPATGASSDNPPYTVELARDLSTRSIVVVDLFPSAARAPTTDSALLLTADVCTVEELVMVLRNQLSVPESGAVSVTNNASNRLYQLHMLQWLLDLSESSSFATWFNDGRIASMQRGFTNQPAAGTSPATPSWVLLPSIVDVGRTSGPQWQRQHALPGNRKKTFQGRKSSLRRTSDTYSHEEQLSDFSAADPESLQSRRFSDMMESLMESLPTFASLISSCMGAYLTRAIQFVDLQELRALEETGHVEPVIFSPFAMPGPIHEPRGRSVRHTSQAGIVQQHQSFYPTMRAWLTEQSEQGERQWIRAYSPRDALRVFIVLTMSLRAALPDSSDSYSRSLFAQFFGSLVPYLAKRMPLLCRAFPKRVLTSIAVREVVFLLRIIASQPEMAHYFGSQSAAVSRLLSLTSTVIDTSTCPTQSAQNVLAGLLDVLSEGKLSASRKYADVPYLDLSFEGPVSATEAGVHGAPKQWASPPIRLSFTRLGAHAVRPLLEILGWATPAVQRTVMGLLVHAVFPVAGQGPHFKLLSRLADLSPPAVDHMMACVPLLHETAAGMGLTVLKTMLRFGATRTSLKTLFRMLQRHTEANAPPAPTASTGPPAPIRTPRRAGCDDIARINASILWEIVQVLEQALSVSDEPTRFFVPPLTDTHALHNSSLKSPGSLLGTPESVRRAASGRSMLSVVKDAASASSDRDPAVAFLTSPACGLRAVTVSQAGGSSFKVAPTIPRWAAKGFSASLWIEPSVWNPPHPDLCRRMTLLHIADGGSTNRCLQLILVQTCVDRAAAGVAPPDRDTGLDHQVWWLELVVSHHHIDENPVRIQVRGSAVAGRSLGLQVPVGAHTISRLEPRHWHCVTLSYGAPRVLLRRREADARLYVDGYCVYDGKHRYPGFNKDKPIELCVGMPAPAIGPLPVVCPFGEHDALSVVRDASAPHTMSFAGRFTAFRLFFCSLTRAQVTGLYTLRPDFVGMLNSVAGASATAEANRAALQQRLKSAHNPLIGAMAVAEGGGGQTKRDHVVSMSNLDAVRSLFTDEVEQYLVLNIHPGISDHGMILDVSSPTLSSTGSNEFIAKRWGTSKLFADGSKLAGVHMVPVGELQPYALRHLKDVMASIGGFVGLTPLLAVQGPGFLSPRSDELKEPLVITLELMRQLVRQEPSQLIYLSEVGFRAIRQALAMNRSLLTPAVVQALLRIGDTDSVTHFAVVSQILAHLPLWARCQVSTQLDVIELLHEQARRDNVSSQRAGGMSAATSLRRASIASTATFPMNGPTVGGAAFGGQRTMRSILGFRKLLFAIGEDFAYDRDRDILQQQGRRKVRAALFGLLITLVNHGTQLHSVDCTAWLRRLARVPLIVPQASSTPTTESTAETQFDHELDRQLLLLEVSEELAALSLVIQQPKGAAKLWSVMERRGVGHSLGMSRKVDLVGEGGGSLQPLPEEPEQNASGGGGSAAPNLGLCGILLRLAHIGKVEGCPALAHMSVAVITQLISQPPAQVIRRQMSSSGNQSYARRLSNVSSVAMDEQSIHQSPSSNNLAERLRSASVLSEGRPESSFMSRLQQQQGRGAYVRSPMPSVLFTSADIRSEEHGAILDTLSPSGVRSNLTSSISLQELELGDMSPHPVRSGAVRSPDGTSRSLPAPAMRFSAGDSPGAAFASKRLSPGRTRREQRYSDPEPQPVSRQRPLLPHGPVLPDKLNFTTTVLLGCQPEHAELILGFLVDCLLEADSAAPTSAAHNRHSSTETAVSEAEMWQLGVSDQGHQAGNMRTYDTWMALSGLLQVPQSGHGRGQDYGGMNNGGGDGETHMSSHKGPRIAEGGLVWRLAFDMVGSWFSVGRGDAEAVEQSAQPTDETLLDGSASDSSEPLSKAELSNLRGERERFGGEGTIVPVWTPWQFMASSSEAFAGLLRAIYTSVETYGNNVVEYSSMLVTVLSDSLMLTVVNSGDGGGGGGASNDSGGGHGYGGDPRINSLDSVVIGHAWPGASAALLTLVFYGPPSDGSLRLRTAVVGLAARLVYGCYNSAALGQLAISHGEARPTWIQQFVADFGGSRGSVVHVWLASVWNAAAQRVRARDIVQNLGMNGASSSRRDAREEEIQRLIATTQLYMQSAATVLEAMAPLLFTFEAHTRRPSSFVSHSRQLSGSESLSRRFDAASLTSVDRDRMGAASPPSHDSTGRKRRQGWMQQTQQASTSSHEHRHPSFQSLPEASSPLVPRHQQISFRRVQRNLFSQFAAATSDHESSASMTGRVGASPWADRSSDKWLPAGITSPTGGMQLPGQRLSSQHQISFCQVCSIVTGMLETPLLWHPDCRVAARAVAHTAISLAQLAADTRVLYLDSQPSPLHGRTRRDSDTMSDSFTKPSKADGHHHRYSEDTTGEREDGLIAARVLRMLFTLLARLFEVHFKASRKPLESFWTATADSSPDEQVLVVKSVQQLHAAIEIFVMLFQHARCEIWAQNQGLTKRRLLAALVSGLAIAELSGPEEFNPLREAVHECLDQHGGLLRELLGVVERAVDARRRQGAGSRTVATTSRLSPGKRVQSAGDLQSLDSARSNAPRTMGLLATGTAAPLLAPNQAPGQASTTGAAATTRRCTTLNDVLESLRVHLTLATSLPPATIPQRSSSATPTLDHSSVSLAGFTMPPGPSLIDADTAPQVDCGAEIMDSTNVEGVFEQLELTDHTATDGSQDASLSRPTGTVGSSPTFVGTAVDGLCINVLSPHTRSVSSSAVPSRAPTPEPTPEATDTAAALQVLRTDVVQAIAAELEAARQELQKASDAIVNEYILPQTTAIVSAEGRMDAATLDQIHLNQAAEDSKGRRTLTHKWFRQVTHERGSWGEQASTHAAWSPEGVFWKRDAWTDAFGTRWRLTRNRRGSQHLWARPALLYAPPTPAAGATDDSEDVSGVPDGAVTAEPGKLDAAAVTDSVQDNAAVKLFNDLKNAKALAWKGTEEDAGNDQGPDGHSDGEESERMTATSGHSGSRRHRRPRTNTLGQSSAGSHNKSKSHAMSQLQDSESDDENRSQRTSHSEGVNGPSTGTHGGGGGGGAKTQSQAGWANDAAEPTRQLPAVHFRDVIMVAPFLRVRGVLSISSKQLLFVPVKILPEQTQAASDAAVRLGHRRAKTVRVLAQDVRAVECRRYVLEHRALEVFAPRTSYFFVFDDEHQRGNVLAQVRRCRWTNMSPYHATSRQIPRQVRAVHGAWERREISNFEYIMRLNRLAGRSFNDLSQYPVFPWVIADYASDELELRDPRSYRDLSCSMGAQTEEGRKRAARKYETSAEMYRAAGGGAAGDGAEPDADMIFVMGPPWNWGSHFSNPGFVCWYLIRLEPFTSCHIILQDGKLDQPDRQFRSVAATYASVTRSDSDVKELTPEWYCCPEMFRNVSNVDFGLTQSGERMDDVQLPPWSKGSPELFVAINRMALESDFVSTSLHRWVDLVFGFKQRGPYLRMGSLEAVRANNVFFHLMYEGAVDLKKLRKISPQLYRQAVSLLENYGQMPPVLFTGQRSSGPRQPRSESVFVYQLLSQYDITCAAGCGGCGGTYVRAPEDVPSRLLQTVPITAHRVPILKIFHAAHSKRLVTIDAARMFGVHMFDNSEALWLRAKLDYTLPAAYEAAESASKTSEKLEATFDFFRKVEGPHRDLLTKSAQPIPHAWNYSHSWPTGRVVDGTTAKRPRRAGHEFAKRAAVLFSAASHSEFIEPAMGQADLGSSLQQAESRWPPAQPGSAEDEDHTWKHERLVAVGSHGDVIITCGHWDNSFKVTSAESGVVLFSVQHHADIVSCVDVQAGWNGHVLPPLMESVSTAQNPTSMASRSVSQAAPVRQSSTAAASNRMRTTSASTTDSALRALMQLYDGQDEAHLSTTAAKEDNFGESDAPEAGSEPCSVHTGADVLVAGSLDCAVSIWVMHGTAVGPKLVDTYYGHDAPVTCVCVKPGLDMVLSCSIDGSVIVYCLETRQLLRSIYRPTVLGGSQLRLHPMTWVGVARAGEIATYSASDGTLYTYSANGRLLCRPRRFRRRMRAFAFSNDGRWLVVGGDAEQICCVDPYNLRRQIIISADGAPLQPGSVHDMSQQPFTSAVTTLSFAHDEKALFAGFANGEVKVVITDANYLCVRLSTRLLNFGFPAEADSHDD